jgi:hypothetical protein
VWDHSYKDHDGLRGYSKPDSNDPDPLDFEDFKREIDTRGGYLQTEVLNSEVELWKLCILKLEVEMLRFFKKQVDEHLQVRNHFVNVEMLSDEVLKTDPDVEEEYNEERRAEWAKKFDERLPKIKLWLQGPLVHLERVDPKDFGKWVRECSHFFEKDDKLYRRQGGFLQIVV